MSRAKGLAGAFGVFGLFWGAWAACLPAIQDRTGSSEAQLGLALLAIAVAALPAMLAAGRLADLLGARLVPIALVAFGVTTVLPALAESPGALILLLLAVGVSTGALDVAINAEASRIEAALRIRVMDGVHAAFSIGVLVGGVGAGLLRHAGATPTWILAGAGAAIALSAVANRGSARAPHLPARRAPLSKGLLVVGGVLGLAFMVEGGLEEWSALFLENTFDSSPAVSGLGPGLFAGSMAAARLLAHRIGGSVVARMVFAGLSAAGGLALAATAQHPAVALAGFVLAGGGLAVSAPTLFGVAGRVGGEGGRGAAVSTVAIIGYLGFLAGPPLIGAVAGATSLRGAFLFLCAVAVVVAACAPALREPASETGG